MGGRRDSPVGTQKKIQNIKGGMPSNWARQQNKKATYKVKRDYTPAAEESICSGTLAVTDISNMHTMQ